MPAGQRWCARPDLSPLGSVRNSGSPKRSGPLNATLADVECEWRSTHAQGGCFLDDVHPEKAWDDAKAFSKSPSHRFLVPPACAID